MTNPPNKIAIWTSLQYGPQWVEVGELKLEPKMEIYIRDTPEAMLEAGYVPASKINVPKEIITEWVFPPIPDRSHDWYARLSFHDGDTDLYGEGETEHDAVVDLIIKANAYEGDGSEQEVVQDLAIAAITLPVTR